MEFYFLNGIAASTRKTYDAAKRRYKQFCARRGVPPLPVTETYLCQFISHLANDRLSHTTIKCYLSAIRHLQVAEGYGDPEIHGMPRLEQVLKGIKSVQVQARPSSKPARLPITPELLQKMKGIWQKGDNQWDSTMLWALPIVGGWMFLICPKLSECLYPTSPLVPLPPESPSDTRVISVVKFNYTYTNPRGTLQFYMNSDPDSAPPGRWQGLNTLPSPDGGHNNEMTGTKEHICNIQLVTQFTHNLTDDATQLVL